VPGVEIENLLAPGDLGSHRYDDGYLAIERALERLGAVPLSDSRAAMAAVDGL